MIVRSLKMGHGEMNAPIMECWQYLSQTHKHFSRSQYHIGPTNSFLFVAQL